MEKLKIPKELISIVSSLLENEPSKRQTHDQILANSFLYNLELEAMDENKRNKLLDNFLNAAMLVELQRQVNEYRPFLYISPSFELKKVSFWTTSRFEKTKKLCWSISK